jgi:hypothetical protein
MLKRQPEVAGFFYPGEPDELEREVKGLLEQAAREVRRREAVGLLAPHAGYPYSGALAARAYATVQGARPASVVLVGPSHRERVAGSAVLTAGSYSTPLGEVEVDGELARAVVDEGAGGVHEGEEGHRPLGQMSEHSLEVQLPFLQRALGGPFRLVPVTMGASGPADASELARAIARASQGRDVLLVASSDLSHFHDDENARRLDSHIRQAVADFDVEAFWQALREKDAEACGAGPVAAVMEASRRRGARRAEEVGYGTSGDVPGAGRDRVVGYLASVFLRDGKEDG